MHEHSKRSATGKHKISNSAMVPKPRHTTKSATNRYQQPSTLSALVYLLLHYYNCIYQGSVVEQILLMDLTNLSTFV